MTHCRIVCFSLLLICSAALSSLVFVIRPALAAGQATLIQPGLDDSSSDIALAASTVQTATTTMTTFLPVVQYHIPLPVKPPVFAPGAGTLYCSTFGSPIQIPDNLPAGITDTINIQDARYIGDLNIYLDIDHGHIGDLVINLTHRSAVSGDTTITAIDRIGYPNQPAGCTDDDMVAILDDDSPLAVEDWCGGYPVVPSIPAIAGIFSPYTPLTSFIGEEIAGDWSINLSDQSSANGGNLNRWCLDVDLTDIPYSSPLPPPPPELPDSAQVSGVYGAPQSLPLDCESRSAVDFAAFFGKSIYEFSFFYGLPTSDNPDTGFVGDVYGLWGQIPPNPYGVHARPIAERLIQYGVEAHYYRRLSWDDVRAEIAHNRPVIVWVAGQARSSYPVYYTPSDGKTTLVAPYEHTVILTGYTPSSVTFLDQGIPYSIGLKQFLNSWSVMRFMAVMAR